MQDKEPRGITNQRKIRRRADGVAVVRFRETDHTAPALDLLTDGEAVYVVAKSRFEVAVYRDRRPVGRTPLCVATPAPAMKPADPDQLRLPT